MPDMGDDRSEVGQPMHRLYVDPCLWRDVPRGKDVRDEVARRESYPAPVVDVDPVRRRRRELAPVEHGVGRRYDRPRVRLGGRFPGEVPSVELFEGSVDVVEIEHDSRRDPLSALISTMRSNSVWNASGRRLRPTRPT